MTSPISPVSPILPLSYDAAGDVPVGGSRPRGGRDNGPNADSFPLPCHFQGGGGSGGGQGASWGGGGALDPYMYGLKWPSHRAHHFEVQM